MWKDPVVAGLLGEGGAYHANGSSTGWPIRLVPLPTRSPVMLLAMCHTPELQCGVHASPIGLPTGSPCQYT